MMYGILRQRVCNLFKSSASKMGNMKCLATNNKLDIEVERIIWVDMEMTGLDVENDKIMEIACLVTDSDLNVVTEGINLVINQPEATLKTMDPWCVKQHGKTGLTQACLDSQVTLEEAENSIYDYLNQHTIPKASPLAGNSVYMDKIFLLKHMPKVCSHLHYRIIDVSTIKELCRRWNLNLHKTIPKKEFTHRALQDINESVEELKFYRSKFFNLS